MTHYYALIHKDKDTTYGISFPDFPGCIGASDISSDAAIEDATQALGLHVEGMLKEGFDIPKPSAMDNILKYYIDGVFVKIPLKINLGKTVRVNITIDQNTLDLIDHEAKTRHMTRSSFMAEAAKKYA